MLFEILARFEEKQLTFDAPAPGAEVTIGAAAENQWQLPWPGVSRLHAVARLSSDSGGVEIEDRGSRNGIRLGDQKAPRAVLRPGASLRLGRATLTLRTLDSADPVVPLPDCSAPSGPLPGHAEYLGSTLELASGSAAAAREVLAFVRRLSKDGGLALSQRPRELEHLRRLLQAHCMLLASSDKAGLTVSDLAGESPHQIELQALGLALVSGVQVPASSSGAWLVARSLCADWVLAARVPASADAPWKELALACCVDRFVGLPEGWKAPTDDYQAPSGETLAFPPEMVVGSSPAFRAMLDELRAVAPHARTFLLLGETGVGKEHVARLIHLSGPTPNGPFVMCNMAQIPPELVDSELFGIEAGIATGVTKRAGLFEKANGGTIFLDEIAEMPLAAQAKLLRFLSNSREVRRVGTDAAQSINVRVVAATNRDLIAEVGARNFREDLFYRLSVAVCRVPPLRDRSSDIPALALAFAARASAAQAKNLRGIRAGTLSWLQQLPWNGNIRQLENAVGYAVMRCEPGSSLRQEHFPAELRDQSTLTLSTPPAPASPPQDFKRQRDDAERLKVLAALSQANGSYRAAAALLGMSESGLRKKRRTLGIQ